MHQTSGTKIEHVVGRGQIAFRPCATASSESGCRARAAAVANYGWDRTFSELIGLYRRLLSKAPSTTRARSNPPNPAPTVSV